jgi:hypothetical protein
MAELKAVPGAVLPEADVDLLSPAQLDRVVGGLSRPWPLPADAAAGEDVPALPSGN